MEALDTILYEEGTQVPLNPHTTSSQVSHKDTTVEKILEGTVSFTPQDLTPEQQNQARENINALEDEAGVIDEEHIATGAVTTDKLADDAVTAKKLAGVIRDKIRAAIVYPIELTYAELKALRDAKKLIAGQAYRITDFVTTSVQADTRSAGHPFDIIIIADDEGTLNENARACKHEGDTYFNDCKLGAWELKYCLDNDANRFAWADIANGKGVVWWLKDEWNNECFYDFKNIQYKLYAATGQGWLDYLASIDMAVDNAIPYRLTGNMPLKHGKHTWGKSTTDFIWAYTWSGYDAKETTDKSLKADGTKDAQSDIVHDCIVGGNWQTVQKDDQSAYSRLSLNFYVSIPFAVDTKDKSFQVYGVRLGENCHDIVAGNSCHSWTCGNNCYSWTCGNNCSSWACEDNCHSWTCGNNCYSWTCGNSCHSWACGNSCYSWTCGNYCHSWACGNICYYWTCGSNSPYWTCGNNCYYWTCGNYCYSWTCGNYCDSWACGNNSSNWICRGYSFYWKCGNNCSSWVCENNCSSWACGNNSSKWRCGDSCSSWRCGDSCSSWRCGGGCSDWACGNNCSSWTCGGGCSNWTCGGGCSDWSCGNNCSSWACGNNSSKWSCGNNCEGWSCGNNCEGWSCGNNSSKWSCGNECYYWICGDEITFGKKILQDYVSYFHLDSGVRSITIKSSGTPTNEAPLKNFVIKSGVKGEAINSKLAIVIDVASFPLNSDYQWTIAKNSSGAIKQYCEADLIN